MRQFLTNIRITSAIKNPLVYTIEDSSGTEIFKTLRSVSKNIKGTWGYSDDEIRIDSNNFTDIYTRKYIAFEEEVDAMQFLLTVKNAKRVYLWPTKMNFTVHVFADSEN